ncbi:MAG: DNA-directed RNA polymerase subunit A' [Candidatus Lokiarchaeota archaeon]|nr:DNA-directed RNA polymerase subunit A' [Candidatus Lokiarchaeota archaeon]MBD3338728.1 DNA-directed RNA polymerase subunit A' [Candidatus Lokiarchaeota archaeon]
MSYTYSRTKMIEKIKFGLLSPDEIRKMSAARIITADTYDEDGLPIPSGLMDQRLGTIEPGQRCQTCGNLVSNCMGHFGHIELARPVIHVGYAKKVLKVLRSICPECSKLMLSEEEKERFRDEQRRHRKIYFEGDEDFTKIVFKKARKSKICPYCGAKKKKIIIEKPTTFYEEEENKGSHRITPIEILERLKKITDSDLRILGISPENARLEWVIFTVLPIPPVCARPSITLDSGIRSEDDLTHKLVDVIRINQRLRENIDAGAPHLIVEDLWELLQYHITTYFDNQVSGIPPARHRSGRALRTLTQRLKGKEGRFRSNLSGKRVDFSARSVISPNPYISINDVGVPKKIARILTIPTNVNDWNIEEMKQLVLNGPNRHPGANYIIRNDRKRIDLRYVKNRKLIADMLAPGFTVERHLNKGDLVLFNRQPSLHRMSIMAHEVKIMNGKTFRLNLTVCPPYNADFDGDEMNLHVPQSEEARTEAEMLLKVQENILSPRFGGPILGGIQDFISSVFQFTSKESIFNKKDTLKLLFMGGVYDTNPEFSLDELEPIATDPEPMYSGKQIFSTLFPNDLNIRVRSKFCKKCFTKEGEECKEMNCPFDAYVTIKNGVLVTGTIDENSFGAMQSNSILQRIIKDHGNAKGREFLDNATKMLLYVIRKNGMTMGLDEVYVKGKAFEEIQSILNEAEKEAGTLITAFNENDTKILKRAPGRSLRETLELRIRQLLAEARKKAEETAAEYIGDEAHSVIMTKSGARGNILNLGQMSAVVGQQAIRGERINRGYSQRTLPHFRVEDLTPKSRGFVSSSYRNGLKPAEFFFHAMGGREGLVDTAVRTSTSGYMQRRLVNALQDLVIENDGTVRTSDKNIVQFHFGDDGVDPMHTDHGKAVNLDVLLLKAKALDLDEIEEKLKELPKKQEKKPKKAKKPAEKKKPKTKKPERVEEVKEEKKEEVPKDEDALQHLYETERGKHAIWRGKITKGYLQWKEEKFGDIEN